EACNAGKGCLQRLRSRGLLLDPGSGGFQQDISQWGSDPDRWLPLLRKAFHAPFPEGSAKTPLPGPDDLVLYFRSFKKDHILDVYDKNPRFSSPPFGFFEQ
ncbi:unnamed protein product, partial [Polarella glacialis]